MQETNSRLVYYELGEQRFRGHLRELSPTGAFILTSATHSERERVRVSWTGWSGSEPVRVHTWGTIERVEPAFAYEGARWPGFSLRFEPQDPEVDAFVQTLSSGAEAAPGFDRPDRL